MTEKPETPEARPSDAEPTGKRGAPPGNRNRTSHGIRGFVVTGSLPKGASYVRRVLAGFRLQLEKDVQEAHGTLSTAHIALIQSATRLEAKALLFQRWLKLEFDKISFSERLAVMDRVTEATLARDKVLEKLGLMSRAPTASGASHDLPETLLAELEVADPQGEGS